MGDQEPKVLPPDSVPVTNRRLKVELHPEIAEEVIAFTAPVDARATKDLALADKISEAEATK